MGERRRKGRGRGWGGVVREGGEVEEGGAEERKGDRSSRRAKRKKEEGGWNVKGKSRKVGGKGGGGVGGW